VYTDSTDPYETHFGINPAALTEISRASVDSHSLKQTKLERPGIGHVNEEIPESTSVPIPSFNPVNIVFPSPRRSLTHFPDSRATPWAFKVKASWTVKGQVSSPYWKLSELTGIYTERTNLQNGLLSTLSRYQDLYITSSSWETKVATREATSLHLLNHVMKYVEKMFVRASVKEYLGNVDES